MTSTIKVNTITTESGSTLTVGGCGKTVALASGASQTGFGRTGTVDWDTTKKTAGFTGVSGNGYFIDTSSGAITVNLPASPSAGDIMALADYAGTAGTNAITVGRNGSNIEGLAADAKIETDRESKTLVFVDATQGWLPVNDNFDSIADTKFVTATGGTVNTCGNFKTHTFTGPGTFCVSCAGNSAGSNVVDYLVVAGGGSGAADNGGGGGAGGFRLSNDTCMPAPQTSPLANSTGLSVPATAYPITVGGGGAPQAHGSPSAGIRGSNSVFSTITSTGGGGGVNPTPVAPYAPGGSGGGARGTDCKGAGNTPSVSPSQGNPGGEDGGQPGRGSGGGGGASAAGGDSPPSAGGVGGAGSFVVSSGFAGCNGTPGPVSGARYFSGGGGGSPDANPGQPPGGAGGVGGGGAGSYRGGPAGTAGTTNTGGGGGGAGNPNASGGGGSGIVIIRYKFQ